MPSYRIILSLLVLLPLSCSQPGEPDLTKEESAIASIHMNYLSGWKKGDKDLVLSLFEENARIQPGTLTPIEGIDEIEKFWFPNDSSVTTINEFTSRQLHMEIMDSLAIVTRRTNLDWDYKKGSFEMGRIQQGVSTTIYRKQPNTEWKIWRKMWTDIYIENK